jgi:hypothetical protein
MNLLKIAEQLNLIEAPKGNRFSDRERLLGLFYLGIKWKTKIAIFRKGRGQKPTKKEQ